MPCDYNVYLFIYYICMSVPLTLLLPVAFFVVMIVIAIKSAANSQRVNPLMYAATGTVCNTAGCVLKDVKIVLVACATNRRKHKTSVESDIKCQQATPQNIF